ncbi:RHS repeat domain-containing protein [Treponema sp. OMZ 788]|uniref:RHS repeat domain-containing protein n=1 Tax=Treponema sp. OMZ 788 TaxID=2563664 RepID=UPI0020A33080|nr:RHS repeat-associated core domain-containing protein [Treponema sp. OMZ 788]
MKVEVCIYSQPNYLPRTAIVREQKQFIKIAFAVHLSAVISAERYRSASKALKSAVLNFVFFVMLKNKIEQSAKIKLLLNKIILPDVFPLTDRVDGSGKTMPFENRWSRYKEPSKNKAEAYLVYVEHLFLRSDAGDARIFSKDDEQAQRVYIKYGNGVETRYMYDEKRRWLDSIETKNNQTQDVFQKIKYSFDPVGNVLGYNNDASTYETKQTYSYDNLYQLISVEGTSNQYKAKKSFGATPVSIAKYKQDFSFDGIGNMKEKISTTNIPGAQGNSYPKAELDYSLAYEYDPAYAHRLIRAGNRYYRYDANGNITAEKDGPFTDEEEFVFTYSYFENEDVYGTDYGFGLDAPKETEQSNPQDLFAYRRNYTWNERNLLTKSSDKNYTVHYRYGEDGQRALKYTDEGRSETLYFNNFFTIHIPTQDQNNPQGLRVHKHIFVGNSRLVTAMTHTDNQGDNDEQKAKRYYYHSDHLGSAQFVTDWKGRQYEHIEYTPYGELWIEEVAAGLDKLPFRFTGKELDEETGLYYYGARYLDPKYSRWLSGDPALNDYIPKAPIDDEAKKHNENLPGMGGVYNTVNLHIYHYAGNNPVKYIDPDGRISLSAILLANPDSMSKEDARLWIKEQVINDNRFPICQKLYALGMNGGIDKYIFGKTSLIAQKMTSVSNHANDTIKSRLKAGKIFGKNGTTAFSMLDTDLFASFGGGVRFDWDLTSVDEKNNIATVIVNIEDVFDFNDGNGNRSRIAEKLTKIGAKAELKSFTLSGEYELKIKLTHKEIEVLKSKLE